MNGSRVNRDGKILAAVLLVWFAAVVWASAAGLFSSGRIPGVAAAILPVFVFVAWFNVSRTFREFILSADVRMLTALQAWRVAGFVFVVASIYGILPKVFGYPAGFGDLAIGLTAPWVASRLAKAQHRSSFITWQILGLLDLAVAVTTAVLASPRFVLLGGGITTAQLTVLPLSVIPTFAVPVAIVVHIVCLAQAATWKEAKGRAVRDVSSGESSGRDALAGAPASQLPRTKP